MAPILEMGEKGKKKNKEYGNRQTGRACYGSSKDFDEVKAAGSRNLALSAFAKTSFLAFLLLDPARCSSHEYPSWICRIAAIGSIT